VSAPEETDPLLRRPEPIVSVFTETYASELRVIVNLCMYVARVTRFKAGAAYIQGAGYTTALV
jgi:hypothetical protein